MTCALLMIGSREDMGLCRRVLLTDMHFAFLAVYQLQIMRVVLESWRIFLHSLIFLLMYLTYIHLYSSRIIKIWFGKGPES